LQGAKANSANGPSGLPAFRRRSPVEAVLFSFVADELLGILLYAVVPLTEVFGLGVRHGIRLRRSSRVRYLGCDVREFLSSRVRCRRPTATAVLVSGIPNYHFPLRPEGPRCRRVGFTTVSLFRLRGRQLLSVSLPKRPIFRGPRRGSSDAFGPFRPDTVNFASIQGLV